MSTRPTGRPGPTPIHPHYTRPSQGTQEPAAVPAAPVVPPAAADAVRQHLNQDAFERRNLPADTFLVAATGGPQRSTPPTGGRKPPATPDAPVKPKGDGDAPAKTPHVPAPGTPGHPVPPAGGMPPKTDGAPASPPVSGPPPARARRTVAPPEAAPPAAQARPAAAAQGPEAVKAVGPVTLPDSPAAVKPQPVEDVIRQFGFEGKPEADLVRKASKDGKVTAKDLDAFLSNPEASGLINSTMMRQMRATLDAHGGKVDPASLPAGWQRRLAIEAIQHGDQANPLTREKLDRYLDKVKANTDQATKTDVPHTWIPDQQQAAITSKVAELTGEPHAMNPTDAPRHPNANAFDYFRLTPSDTANSAPKMASYTLTHADRAEVRPTVSRDGDATSNDKKLQRSNPFANSDPNHPVKPGTYTGTGLDRGHAAPSDSRVNQRSLYQTFDMQNMSAQHPNHNRQVIRRLEQATTEIVEANKDSRAIVHTGPVYLDPTGKPLPADKIPTVDGKDGVKLHVPSHTVTAVLLERPDGTKSMFAYMVPNEVDAKTPSKDADVKAYLDRARVSVADVEKVVGHTLFPHLNPGEAALLKADTSTRIPLPDSAPMAKMLLGQ